MFITSNSYSNIYVYFFNICSSTDHKLTTKSGKKVKHVKKRLALLKLEVSIRYENIIKNENAWYFENILKLISYLLNKIYIKRLGKYYKKKK